MKSAWLVALCAVLLGSTIGVGSTLLEFNSKPSYVSSKPKASGHIQIDEPVNGRAKVVVQGPAEYDFGVMSKDEERSHTFVVLNDGDAPLELRFIEKSCQCTDVEMSRSIVPPGDTTDIKLSWRPNNFGLHFGQVARFETNDPARIELDLAISGRVQQIYRPVPSSLSFDSVEAKRGREIQLVVYGYRHSDLIVESVEFLDESTADYFAAEISELDEARIASEPGARSGASITLRLKPGLPIGPIHQRIRVQTNRPELTPLELPIRGTIVGNFQVFGPQYDDETSVLRMGTLAAGKDEYLRKLWILVKRDDSAASSLRIASTDPEGILEASLDDPTPMGPRLKYPLTIRVKSDGRMLNRLGSKQGSLARIVIESEEENSPQLIIYVSFLLEADPS